MSDKGLKGAVSELRPWLHVLGRRRSRLLLGALLMLGTVASGIGLLGLSGWFITATAITGALLASGAVVGLDVFVPGGGIRFFALSRTATRYFERLYNHDSVLRLLADLRGRLFSILAGLDAHSLRQRRASEWLNRLTADIDTLDSLYLRLLAPPGVALLAIMAVSVLLGWLMPGGWSVGLVLLALWGWSVAGQAYLGYPASQRRVATLDRLRSRTIEHVQGVGELRAFGTLGWHRRDLSNDAQSLYCDQRRLAYRSAFGNALVGLGVGLALLAALWLGIQAYRGGVLSGPLMVLVALVVLALGEALVGLPSAFTHLGATQAAVQRLNALRRSRSRLVEPERPRALPGGALSLRFDEVTLRYPGSPISALDSISLQAEAGERVALLGASGAGKTSIALLAARLLDPQEGAVLLGDIDLRELSLDAVRSHVGYLTQATELFDDSLANNLRLAAPEASEAALWNVLEIVELDAWVAALPRQLETPMGENGRQVSGGQVRRLGLARVLLRDAPLVILDEPFSGLDAPLAARIAQRLDRWLEGRTVLFLAHERSETRTWLPRVKRTYALREGRLVDEASSD
ncbi:thiol reductant ABC exporter subunit CydC [Litchfieldella xinjiangensis]|uniref:thiol reductant ABC exporter subunit CydC n=1 Tax=Litchfieldella xinjiangensis TaxID=1166948 RepID=UPI000A3E536B|nr:thiol reductant ABC exporter subunit CydC [Halomonas xinjiangensis]